MPDEYWRDVRQVRIFERRVGDGPCTVVLHGGPGAHHDYLRPGFDRLAAGRTLIYYDQRGSGQSIVSRDIPVGWTEHVADLEALRQAWGFDRLTLAGYSWGALLALLYTIQFPDRVASLALVSPAPVWRAARDEFNQRFSARNAAVPIVEERGRLAASGLRESDPSAYRRRMFELSVAGYFHDWRRARDLTPFRITGRTQQEVWESLRDFDLRWQLEGLSVRAIVLHGDDDPIPYRSAEVLASLLGAPFHLIPDCGHVPYVEAPETFTALLNPFLPRSEHA